MHNMVGDRQYQMSCNEGRCSHYLYDHEREHQGEGRLLRVTRTQKKPPRCLYIKAYVVGPTGSEVVRFLNTSAKQAQGATALKAIKTSKTPHLDHGCILEVSNLFAYRPV